MRCLNSSSASGRVCCGAATAWIAAWGLFVEPAEAQQPVAPPSAVADGAKTVVEPGYLGVLADNLPDRSPGIKVLDVMAAGPAQVSGLRPGDVITSIDGRTTASVDDMATLLAGRPAGDQVTFVVRRGNQVERVEVRLGTRPPVEQRPQNFGAAAPSTIPHPTAITPNPLPTTISPAKPIAAAPVPNPPTTPAAPREVAESLPEPKPLNQPAQPIQPAQPVPPSVPNALRNVPSEQAPPAGDGMLLGIRAVPVSPEIQKAFALPHPHGALVVEVRPGSPAQGAGLPLDAVITEVDGIRVDTPTALADIVLSKGRGAEVRISYYRFGQLENKAVRLGGGEVAPAATTATAPQIPAVDNKQVAAEAQAVRAQIRELEARLVELEAQLNGGPPPAKKP